MSGPEINGNRRPSSPSSPSSAATATVTADRGTTTAKPPLPFQRRSSGQPLSRLGSRKLSSRGSFSSPRSGAGGGSGAQNHSRPPSPSDGRGGGGGGGGDGDGAHPPQGGQHSGVNSPALNFLRGVQDVLDFKVFAKDPEKYPQFAPKTGLGRVAILSCVLGLGLGSNLTLLAILWSHILGLVTVDVLSAADPPTLVLLRQWLLYTVSLAYFHLSEFFVTAGWNPSTATADSFVVNQSLAYTAAALVSWAEFWVRFALFPSVNSAAASAAGLAVVVVGQACRTAAMVTCGESFNHVIQRAKKENHRLVTHGIYRYLRHPSYFGFYWWSVGTQLLLGNPLCTAFYAAASWYFFRRRVPYEEATLLRHFPDEYPAYTRRSWIGIPFVRGAVVSDGGSDGEKKSQ